MSENQYIEQFMILAKNQKAKALETIIEQVLSHANIFVFGEFLHLPNVQEVTNHFDFQLILAYLSYFYLRWDKSRSTTEHCRSLRLKLTSSTRKEWLLLLS